VSWVANAPVTLRGTGATGRGGRQRNCGAKTSLDLADAPKANVLFRDLKEMETNGLLECELRGSWLEGNLAQNR
jgi:hypothetical protein